MTKSINALILECFQIAANELDETIELEALLVVLGHIKERPGLITDQEMFLQTCEAINKKCKHITKGSI